MADEKTLKRRGHPVKGRNRGGQLRALHAKGVLKSSGKGKGRKTSYSPGRTVIGGSKAAGLRSGSGSGGGRSAGPTRAERIAAGRSKAQAFMGSERGQRIRSGVEGLRATSQRTGRRDYDKPRKVAAAKADLKAAGVKVKTGQALAKRFDTRRLRGDYSGPSRVNPTPLRARQQADSARKAQRATAREATLASTRGKSRSERIAAGRAIANEPLNRGRTETALYARYQRKRAAGQPITAREREVTRPLRIQEGKVIADRARAKRAAAAAEQARAAQAQQAARTRRRLRARDNRVARGEARKETQRQQRLTARNKRAEKAPALDRSRRIKAGRAALDTFRRRRDSLYNGTLF